MTSVKRILWVITFACVIAETPVPAHAYTWDFNDEGNPGGWLTKGDADGGGSSAELIVSDGILRLPVTSSPWGTKLVSPRLKLDASLYDRLIIRIRVDEGAFEGTLHMGWRTEDVSTYDPVERVDDRKAIMAHSDPLIWRDEWQEIVFTGFTEGYWVGTVIRFDLGFSFSSPDNMPPEDRPEEIWVDWITLTGVGAEVQGDPIQVIPDTATGEVFGRYVSYRMQDVGRASGGDVDGDGDVDLIATVSSGATSSSMASESFIHVLFNAGDATFPEARVYAMGPGGMGIPRLVDLDSDGILDVVVGKGTGTGSTLLTLKGLGEGRFSMDYDDYGDINPGTGKWFGDLDGDGDVDIAVSTWKPETVSILFNRGDGTFSEPVVYPTKGDRIVGADLDGDEDTDLVVTRRIIQDRPGEKRPDEVVIFLNDGEGELSQWKTYPVGRGPISVASGDFDKDGDADLAVANRNDNFVSVLLNRGDATFSDAVAYPVGKEPFVLMAGEFTGDGYLDLVSGHILETNVWLLVGSGDGTFVKEGTYPVSGSIYGLFGGDLDGDGDLDIVAVDNVGDNICILLNGMEDRSTPVEEQRRTDLPIRCMLHPCYPNPFNASVMIRYDLPLDGSVRLCLYDVVGQRIRTLVDETKWAGSHGVVWDGRDDDGREGSSGMYLWRIEAQTENEVFVDAKKGILLR